MKRFARAALAAGLVSLAGGTAVAQDAAKVDPKHYKVVADNARVRVLRIHYGPHETSIKHWHPDSVVTYLTDGHMKFLLANGRTITADARAGGSAFEPAGVHTPTNLSNKAFDAVLVELKGK